MTAYVISEVTVLDEEAARAYREAAAVSIAQHGGRYLARGETPVAIEDDWPENQRMVIIAFPSMSDARRWYDSPEYAEARSLRQTALDRRLLFVAGTPEDSSENLRACPLYFSLARERF